MSNSATVLVVSAILSAGVAFAITTLLKPAPLPAPDESQAISELKQELAELRERARNLTAEVERVRTAPVTAAVDRQQVATVSDEQVAASVTRWFADHGGAKAMDAAGLKADAAAKFDAKGTWQQLRGTSAWDPNQTAAWKKVFESGHMDDLLAYFEQQVKDNPGDAKSQLDLASAYLSAMQFDRSQWQLSIKADQCYDKVLEQDATNWDARFSKAVSYTFWPPVLGKGKEAIGHFETLVEQQKTMPPSPNQAQTYLMLGNLYEQRGDTARARQVWQQGSQRHPENADLRNKAGG